MYSNAFRGVPDFRDSNTIAATRETAARLVAALDELEAIPSAHRKAVPAAELHAEITARCAHLGITPCAPFTPPPQGWLKYATGK